MKLLWFVAAGVLTLVLLAFAAGAVLLRLACGRPRRNTVDIDAHPEDPKLRRYREYILPARQWLAQHASETVSTQSFDGLRLQARWVPCENARGSVLCFHGWRSCAEVDFGAVYQFYHERGFQLLLVDERAQGASDGRYMTFGVRERRDVHSWLRWHNETVGADKPVFLTGVSMGATTVLMACGEPLPANVCGVLADCGFTSPYEIFCSVARSVHLPARPAAALLGVFTRLFAGFDLKEYSTIDAMHVTTLPVFLAHGEADTFVPCEMSRSAYAACKSADKTLLTVPDAGHGHSYLKQPERYRAAVIAFLERALQEKRSQL